MQIIYTSLQSRQIPVTMTVPYQSLFSFYKPDAVPDAQPTAAKHSRIKNKLGKK